MSCSLSRRLQITLEIVKGFDGAAQEFTYVPLWDRTNWSDRIDRNRIREMLMKHSAAILLVVFTALLALQPLAAAEKLRFNRDIRSILSDKCFACHGNDKNKRSVDMRLDQRDSALAAKAIVPGKPEESEVLRRILSDDPDVVMPPPHAKLGRLNSAQVATIRQWIAEGADY